MAYHVMSVGGVGRVLVPFVIIYLLLLQDKKRWVQRSVMKKCLLNTPQNYLEHIQAVYNSQDNSQHNHVPIAQCLGDGVLKEEYESQVRVRRAEDNVQIEQDDLLALELLQEEESLLQKDRERREAMLLEDSRIAAELSLRMKSEAPSSTARDSFSSSKKTKEKLARGATGQKNRLKREDSAGRTNGILKYFNSHMTSSTESQSSSQGSNHDSGSHSSSSIEGDGKKRPLDTRTYDKSCHLSSVIKRRLDHPLPSNSININSAVDLSLSPPPLSSKTISSETLSSSPILTPQSAHNAQQTWNCAICTFCNFGLLQECEMCGEKRGTASSG